MRNRLAVQIGDTYARWTVLSLEKRKALFAICRCQCGTERAVCAATLPSGASKSCGCLKSEVTRARRTKHGLGLTPEYAAWRDARDRCERPENPAFANYGGRGIAMCKRWSEGEDGKLGVTCFFEDMGARPTADHSLERLDVDGDYTPENCCWATYDAQVNNTRRNRVVALAGERLTAAQLAKRVGLPYKTVLYRMDHNWSAAEIAAKPFGWRPTKYRTQRHSA